MQDSGNKKPIDKNNTVMPFNIFIAVILFFLFFPSLGITAPNHISVKEEYCTSCHTKIPVNPSYPTPGNLPFRLTPLCGSCHQKIAHSHVVDIKPANISTDLPLNAFGEIDCNTCHDLHNKSEAVLLRITQKKLCLICHKK